MGWYRLCLCIRARFCECEFVSEGPDVQLCVYVLVCVCARARVAVVYS